MSPKITFSITILLLALTTAPVHAEEYPELTAAFSAQMRTVEGDPAVTARIWVDGALRRQESEIDGIRNSVIVRADRGEVFVFDEEDDSALKLPFSPGTDVLLTRERLRLLNPVFEARETVNGERALRFAFEGPNAMGAPEKGLVWVTPDGIPLRQESETTFEGELIRKVIEYVGIERGRQDRSVFELPEGMIVEEM